jgi:tetratricopeptide (TPR) repeat protein
VPDTDVTAALAAAEALLDVDRLEEARARAASIVAGEPGNAAALCLLARCHIKLDDAAAALDAATGATQVEPDRPEAHILRATALLTLDRPQEALTAADAAAALAPNHAGAHLVRALALFDTFDRREGWAALDRATRLAPHWADLYAIRGNIHHTLGYDRKARAAYRKALAINPQHAGATEGLARVALRQGRLGAAVRQFGAAAALAPTGRAAAAGVDLALTRLLGWGLLVAWIAAVALVTAGRRPLGWAVAAPVLLAYTGWIVFFWRRLPGNLRGAVRARTRADPRQRVRIVVAALTLGLGVVIALVEPTPRTGDQVLIVLLGCVAWLTVTAGVVVFVDVRRMRQQAPETLNPDQQSNVQLGRLTLRWFRTTALVAIVPSVLAAAPAAPLSARATAGSFTIAFLVTYYRWTIGQWRRRPGRPLGPMLAHILPAFYLGLSALWLATVTAAFWPGQPPGVTIAGFMLGALTIVFYVAWLPVRAVRALLR